MWKVLSLSEVDANNINMSYKTSQIKLLIYFINCALGNAKTRTSNVLDLPIYCTNISTSHNFRDGLVLLDGGGGCV